MSTNSHLKTVLLGMRSMVFGSLTSKLIAFVSMPLITRLFSPESIGASSVVMAIIFMISPILNGRYSSAIPIPRSENAASSLIRVAITLTIIVTFLISLIFLLLPASVFEFFGIGSLASWWYLIPLGALLYSLFEIITNVAVRGRDFKRLAITTSLQSLYMVLGKVLTGIIAPTASSLIVASLLSYVLTVLHLFKGRVANLLRFSLRRDFSIARKYSDFPRYRLLAQLLMMASLHIPVIVFSTILSAREAGFLSLAISVLAVPITVFGKSVAQPYFSEIAKIGRENKAQIRDITVNLMKRMAVIGVGPTLLLALLGEEIFVLVFGAEWRASGTYSSVLSISLFFQFLSTPFVQAFNVFNLHRYFLILNLRRVIISVAILGGTLLLGVNPTLALLIYSIGLAFHYIMLSLKILSYTKSPKVTV